ncbi:MAG: T9SS type A sorting domain-containing protein, partial [Bacteroidota bacterium]|nr:T9SS type A sorting domain-containing protein [Bacteroidota bacterium]
LSVNDKRELVSNFSLSQNYPNPFNPSTNIQYYIPSECRINVTVYNALGAKVKELVNGTEPMGSYEVKFDGTGLASGIYFVTLKAASTDGKQSFVSSKKMILMK